MDECFAILNIKILRKGHITFHFFFPTKTYCESVLVSRPSCYEYHMVAPRPWDPGIIFMAIPSLLPNQDRLRKCTCF